MDGVTGKAKVIRITSTLTDEYTASLASTLLEEDSYDTLVTEDCDVIKPDGSYLVRYRRNILPVDQCLAASINLRNAAKITKNRATAAGAPTPKANEIRTSRTQVQRVLPDGSLSNTHEAKEVLSGIVGYFTPTARFPYCRMTSFALDNPKEYMASLPLIRSASDRFRELMPDRWQAQKDHIERTSTDFTIHGTVFTTFTVNKNWQTAVHQDKGDLKVGFGVMTVLRSGVYDGCYLVFPKFRVAVDMRTRCLCLADVHEWHGNTPFRGEPGFERLSLVLYYREKMDQCGSAANQLTRVKNRRQGDKLL